MTQHTEIEDWVEYFKSTTVLSNYFYNRRTLLRKILRYSSESSLILEVGAGTGWSSVSLALTKRHVVALDLSTDVLRRIRRLSQNLGVSLNDICADMIHMPFRDDIFQVAFSQGVLEHFNDNTIAQAVQEQIRVAPIIIIDIPTDKARNQLGSYGDERWLSWKYWKNLIVSAGVECPVIYGKSPSQFGYLLPVFLFKLFGYRFSMGVGFVCSRKNSQFKFGGLRERLVD